MDWKFWQKDDDPLADLPPDLSGDFSSGGDTGFGPSPDPMNQPPGMPTPQQPQAYTPDNHPPGMVFTPAEEGPTNDQTGRLQYDVIIARLDSIKAQLENINQRLSGLEQREQQEAKQRPRGPWYTK